jgi:hypothetical protein
MMGGNVRGHHCPSANYSPVADGHAFEKNGAGSAERAATGDDRLGIVGRGKAPDSFAGRGVKIVIEDHGLRPDIRPLTDVNPQGGAYGTATQAHPAAEDNFRAGP